jgi:spoIIIJ-associated protein
MDKKYTLVTVKPRIEKFLDAVLTDATIELDFVVHDGETRHPDFENPEVVVKFSGPDVDLLLSNKAELLLALEQLTMEALRMPLEDHSRLCFDANDYRMLRIEELRMSALTAADRVKHSHMPFRFNPMNSRERRIIHLALRGETAVRSESAGLGMQRQVVVYPADMPTPPDAAQAYEPPRPDERRPMRRPGRRRF